MKVFLSYPSEHEQAAREVKDFVRSVGIDCWFDKDSLLGGMEWDRERRQAQVDADLFLLLCAKELVTRDGVYQREIREALRQFEDKRLGGIYILPLRLDDVELPEELSRFHYIDHFSPNWRQKLAASFLRAMTDLQEDIPPMLQVAATPPDEGGITTRDIKEETDRWELVVDWPQYELRGDYWDFVNSVILREALGGLYEARRHMAEWQNPGHSSWEMHISEFHRRGQLVSLTIGENSYYAGAAHPNHGVRTINILGDIAGILSIEELFDYSSSGLPYLNEYVNLDLKRQYLATGEDIDLSFYQESEGWGLYRYYSFNEAGIRLNLSAYSGLAHAFGYHEVYIPWENVGHLLAPVPKRILLPDLADDRV